MSLIKLETPCERDPCVKACCKNPFCSSSPLSFTKPLSIIYLLDVGHFCFSPHLNKFETFLITSIEPNIKSFTFNTKSNAFLNGPKRGSTTESIIFATLLLNSLSI